MFSNTISSTNFDFNLLLVTLLKEPIFTDVINSSKIYRIVIVKMVINEKTFNKFSNSCSEHQGNTTILPPGATMGN